ncbi:hypothetical protein DRH27_04980 [Candidatus Falkowbacteria bacterium]|nr:MAG: hypothetical protein DRH27_04980 [Candidatus Falkowbacteria bacterium]
MWFKKKNWQDYFAMRKVNKVIRILTISDVIIISGFGLVSPIFAIFIADTIKGGTLEVVGIASSVYLIAKSLIQIPAANFIDRMKGEKDDFWALFIGSVIYSLIPLLYLAVNTPIELYIVQFFYGIATAITLPSWYAIFTRHIDKKHEGLEWGVYETLVGLGAAGAASLGGFLAFRFGFNNLFILVSLTSLIGSMFLLGVYKSMKSGKLLFK